MLCKCGKPVEWDFKDYGFCQECWEAECDREWWEMYIRLGEAGLIK